MCYFCDGMCVCLYVRMPARVLVDSVCVSASLLIWIMTTTSTRHFPLSSRWLALPFCVSAAAPGIKQAIKHIEMYMQRYIYIQYISALLSAETLTIPDNTKLFRSSQTPKVVCQRHLKAVTARFQKHKLLKSKNDLNATNREISFRQF